MHVELRTKYRQRDRKRVNPWKAMEGERGHIIV
jgi:hypothetical protein